ncbi:MAG: SH3 domain-containing protein [Verrucomicrobia bacterium]|nr:SH3 domain-containing protein [Verrucomicrobiota bacterium]MCG2681938.1 SH3 domain-containing protein [Kiritimatiellia bacterium]MBU4247138.1 SH3 domain-containing protein [Verrucomicrobiota bacterium]MBU4290979.1 SH3 domain-containing protein [Verrucomicrobiota bacterium]MBU4430426.1 SH3 domain-containing protein [Verrucomicrobiota bacterium]
MRQIKRWMGTVGLAALTVVSAWAAAGKMMSVQVKDAQMRDKPSFIGKVVGSLAYGDRVEVQESQGAWARVSLPGGTAGWLHTSALTSQKIALSAGKDDAKVGASGDELALAGKGFNSDIEAQFKKTHKAIDFTWVDKMEKIKIPSLEIQTFLKDGGVVPKGGAQ